MKPLIIAFALAVLSTGALAAKAPIVAGEMIIFDDHFPNPKTRAEVHAELVAARARGELAFGELMPVNADAGAARSRAEVRAEVREALAEGLINYGESYRAVN
jgi:hypothetical protein